MNCDRKPRTRDQCGQSNPGKSSPVSIECLMKITKEAVSGKPGPENLPPKKLRADAESFEPAFFSEYSSHRYTRKDLSAGAQVFVPSYSFDCEEPPMEIRIERIEDKNFDFSFEPENPSVKPGNTDPKIENISADKTENTEKNQENIKKPQEKTEESTENSSESSEITSKSLIKNGKIPNDPPSPKKLTTFDQSTILSLKTIFDQDPNFYNIPEILKELINRPIVLKNSKTQKRKEKEEYEGEEGESLQDTAEWRKSKTIEEQKILSQAKEYQKKFSISQDEQILITKSIKITLNKLSPNNLEKLSLSLLETCKKSHDYLKLVVSGIFEKAWSEKKYTQMYSDLCKTLKTQLEKFKYPDPNLPITQNYFKYELLKLCEETFSFLSKDQHPSTPINPDTQSIGKVKMKTLGNVRFIGELFNVNLISAKIVLECINSLLDTFQSDPHEDKLEGACLLLETGGISFERHYLKPATNTIYERLEELMESPISPRIKFKIMDLTEFRANGWKNSQKDLLKKPGHLHLGPKTENPSLKK